MILRVFRGSAGSTERELVVAHVRDVVYALVGRMPGLRSFQTGIRERPDGRTEFVLVSTWQEFEHLMEALGPDLEHPAWLRDVDSRIQAEQADQFELVGEELRGVIPMTGGRLTISHGTLASGPAESFFDAARAWQADLLDRGLVLASHIGRRISGAHEDAVSVIVRGSEDGEGAEADAITEPDDAFRDYFAQLETAVYDAIARVDAKPGAVPALLLADDERRYVFATPAAGRLLGRPVSRILGRRVEEVTGPGYVDAVPDMWARFIAEGLQAGDFTLTREDGSLAHVSFVARANTPWPGCHATVLAEPGADVDFDDALAAAGLIARYVVAAGAGR
ncbi:MAG TPA: PAS domain-containing protein [Candidatus Limnocylindrales bacterium]|nr:PAS domain-containing protein [Candidatus Limnocylindrales bacterium]